MGESRNRTKTVTLWALGVAVGALVIAGVVGLATGAYRVGTVFASGSTTVDEHRDFGADGVGRVRIDTVSERVRLTESKDDRFAVHLMGTISASDESAIPRLEAGVHGATLDVVVRHKSGLVVGFYGGDLSLEVAVPKRFAGAMEITTVSGAIDAAPHAYESVAARTTSGAINLDSLESGPTSARSVSGAIRMEGLKTSRVTAGTTSGRIVISTSAATLELRSVSGAIETSTSAQPESIDIGTTSGRVTLRLPEGSQFALDARSTSGEVRCDFPITITRSAGGRHDLSGTVGSAAAGQVKIRTTSGAISVTR